MYGGGRVMVRGFRTDPPITKQKLKPGTVRRIARYARPYRVPLAAFILATSLDALIIVVNPLLLREIIGVGGSRGRGLRCLPGVRDALVFRADRGGAHL
jgi:ATP-binding cassette, subfamily B, bacterial